MRDIAAEAGISHPGLLRHYSSKSEMLMEIVQRMEDDNYRWYASPDKQRDQTAAVQLAERNTQRHGYLAVFTALAGEATSPQHPAHAYMRDHYAKMREFDFSDFPSGAPLGEGRRPADEAVRFIAAWDGLQLLELYAPQSINTAEELSAHTTMILSPFGSRGPEPRDRSGHRALVSPSDLNAVTPLQGNTVGRARREQIVADAMTLFAVEGYGDTSMRAIAEKVGVSKASLFYHYETKEDLLRAVLVARDEEAARLATQSAPQPASAVLHRVAEDAATSVANAPGLIEVYTVLSCEATPPRHPAHDYFVERFTTRLAKFTTLFERAAADGDLPAHRDPVHEARWLTALVEGLQIQWLYDRGAIDIAHQLTAHLQDVLPASSDALST